MGPLNRVHPRTWRTCSSVVAWASWRSS